METIFGRVERCARLSEGVPFVSMEAAAEGRAYLRAEERSDQSDFRPR
jgi:hypothetical protein